MRQSARSRAELRGKAVWVGNRSAMRAEFRGVPRKVVLVRRRGGRCGDGDIEAAENFSETQESIHSHSCMTKDGLVQWGLPTEGMMPNNDMMSIVGHLLRVVESLGFMEHN